MKGRSELSPDSLLAQDLHEIVGMERFAPIEVQSLDQGNAEKLVIGAIDELAQAVESADPDRRRGAVGDRTEPLLAFRQAPFGQLASCYVLDDAIHSGDPPILVAMRNMDDFGVDGPARPSEISLVGHRLTRQGAIDERPPGFVHRGIHDLDQFEADNLAQRTSEPILVGLVGEAKDSVVVDIRNQQRQGVGDGAKPFFAGARDLFGLLAIRDVEMGADQFEGAAILIAFDFRDRSNPTHLAVARAEDPVFGFVMLVGARDRIAKVFLGPDPVVRMNTLDPLLVRFVRRARRQAVKVKIFRRAPSAKAVPQIDFHSADASDPLNSSELQFALAQRLGSPSTIRDVAKRRADALAERKGAHLVIAIRAQGRKALELLTGALRHHPAVASLKFGADDSRRDLPKNPAYHRRARQVEYFFRRAIESGEAPVRIQCEETFSDPLEEGVDRRLRAA